MTSRAVERFAKAVRFRSNVELERDKVVLEPDLDISRRRDVNAVDESNLMRIVLHDNRARPGAVAEKTDAAHQRAVGDAGGGKDDLLARGEFLRAIDFLEVGNPHRATPLFVFRLVDHEAREDLAIEATH